MRAGQLKEPLKLEQYDGKWKQVGPPTVWARVDVLDNAEGKARYRVTTRWIKTHITALINHSEGFSFVWKAPAETSGGPQRIVRLKIESVTTPVRRRELEFECFTEEE